MRRTLQALLVFSGVACLGIALAHLFFGAGSYIGGGPVSATIDSDLRFFNVLFAVYGLCLAWCAKDVERKFVQINVLGGIFAAGGTIARGLSWLIVGPPNPFYQAMLAVEVVVPIALLLLSLRVCRPRRPFIGPATPGAARIGLDGPADVGR